MVAESYELEQTRMDVDGGGDDDNDDRILREVDFSRKSSVEHISDLIQIDLDIGRNANTHKTRKR